MVNHFRERMPRSIFGIAHSMGAPQLSDGRQDLILEIWTDLVLVSICL